MPLDSKRNRATTSASRREMAYQTLRRMILTGELQAGTQIVEAEIAEKLKISRTPIRESILRLENEGLLRVVPYKGIFVSEMSVNNMKDLLQLRFWLEHHAVQEGATRVTDADIEEMGRLIDDQDRALREQDMLRFMELDREFHMRIARAVGNAVLLRILENLRDQLVACGLQGLAKPERAAQVLDEHREILTCLRFRDAEGAVRAMNQHLVKVRDSVLEF